MEHQALSNTTTAPNPNMGVQFKRVFTNHDQDPFKSVEWENRTVAIYNDRGQTIFEQKDVEVPKTWSQLAANVVASKYLHGETGTKERESSIRAMILRVVNTITVWGEKEGYFSSSESRLIFRDELIYILLHQYAAFNSPVWFNVGVQEKPQCSACFIISVKDTMDSLLELQNTEAKLFKYGSGTGTNLSTIRSSKERLSGGGIPSGPVSFMRAYDGWANVIKSGGKTRRAAKMQILNVTHPDIIEFINCKSNEEKKAWALIEEGYDGGLAVPGGAYDSVSFQNSNLSVRVSDEFMSAAENNKTYFTKNVVDDRPCEELNAAEVLKLIAKGTHICGDPGLQFDTTINKWHTCPNSGRINASNPCSEYMHVDDSACNLASINLLKYLQEDGTFDVEGFKNTVDVLFTAQDILINNASYPTPRIEKSAKEFRQIGLGYANLGALLMSEGVPYDSEEGRGIAAGITALMTGEAYRMSAKLAERVAPFHHFKKNRKAMLHIMQMHRDASKTLLQQHTPEYLADSALGVWEEAMEQGRKHGFRNSQATVLAPTGTISLMMDCDTTGVEPDIALIKYKKLVGGGFLKLVNQSVVSALKKLGYTEREQEKILDYIDKNETIEGAPALKNEHLPIFDCALRPIKGTRSIEHLGHIKMLAAVQPFISGAISKTVNLPNNITEEEIAQIYLLSWKMGLKAVALYRDGSKRVQPLTTASGTRVGRAPVRRRLPDERRAITHKFSIAGLEGYLTVGLYEDGAPGEIFLVVAKEGSTLSGMMDAFATSVSLALQYGVPLAALVKKFAHLRFEPAGFTHTKEIPMAKSIIDYVFRWLGMKFLSVEDKIRLGLKSVTLKDGASTGEGASSQSNGQNGHLLDMQFIDGEQSPEAYFQNMEDAPPCTICGSSMMVRQGACYVCLNCGSQGGCG